MKALILAAIFALATAATALALAATVKRVELPAADFISVVEAIERSALARGYACALNDEFARKMNLALNPECARARQEYEAAK